MLCAIIAFVTFPLAASTIMTQTPLPVTLACFAWYGYSGKGALTAIAWAADNDKEVGVEKVLASDCTGEGALLLTRCFFSAGAAGIVDSSALAVSSIAGAGFSVVAVAAISRLRAFFFFFSFGGGVATLVSMCSGRFGEVASWAGAKGALASTTPLHKTARVPRCTIKKNVLSPSASSTGALFRRLSPTVFNSLLIS